MEQKIGEIFEHNGEWYQCVEGVDTTNCSDCDIQGYCIRVKPKDVGQCLQWRSDKKKAIFKKLKKVGEPYMSDGHLMQTLSGEKQPNSIRDHKTRMCYYSNCLLRIEIKQYKEKEYMEEKKLNLKPFDLEAAKEGKPVCTRDGRKARIICFDLKNNVCPIVAAVEENNNMEVLYHYDTKGLNCYKKSEIDLMMLPEKKEGWINIYNADTTFYYVDGRVFETKDEAVQEAKEEVEKEQREKNEYIDTIRVEWEE